MGRKSQGYCTTDDALVFDLSNLTKGGFLRPGSFRTTSWNWTRNGEEKVAEVAVFICFLETEKYIRFMYNISHRGEPETNYDYKVLLHSKPSNLGKGQVLYFVCPISGRLCRKLYLAYNSPYFKCRQAYNARIYYFLQQSSKMARTNDQYFHFKRKLEAMDNGRGAYKYAGKLTKRAERIIRTLQKRDKADHARWEPETFPVRWRRAFEEDLLNENNSANS